MTTSLLAPLVSAGLLGVTHAVEPDHVAGISALTRRHADARRSTLAGVCFAVGHVALVVVWVLLGYLLLGRSSYPPLFDSLGAIGVGVLLGLLGATTTLGGLRRLRHVHDHERGAVVHRHSPLHGTRGGSADRGHDHGAASFVTTGIVGALFTLSPPLSMIAFASTVVPAYGPRAVALAVGVYAVAIVGTMGLLGAGVGALSRRVGGASDRTHGAVQLALGLALGAVSLGVLAETLGLSL